MNELHEIEIKLVEKYLIRHYKIWRLKNGKHFNRAIIVNESPYFLKDKSNLKKLREYIMDDIKLVFGFNKNEHYKIIQNYIY